MGKLEREEQAKSDLVAIRVSLFMVLLAVILFFLVGCATWTPCTDPYADYPGCPDRKTFDAGKMCLGPVA